MINSESLKVTLSLIREDNELGNKFRYKFSSKFLALYEKILCSPKSEVKPPIAEFLQYIHQDLNALIIIAKQLAWQKELWMAHKLTDEDWTDFAQLDVDIFFTKVSSIFDYVAAILYKVADNPSEIPEKHRNRENFNTMRIWLMNTKDGKENSKNLGQDLADLVRFVDWFETIREVRNSITHKGSFSLIFPDKNGILFQVYKCSEKLSSIPEIMYNENVVDFELFAGLYFGYLIAFLEDFAIAVEKRLPQNLRNRVSSPWQPYKDLPAIFKWTMKLL